jgi:hypothetical protein
MNRAEREARRLRQTAYHEAGHAVADHVFERKVRRVTIVPNLKDQTLGTCDRYPRPALLKELEGCFTSWSPAKTQYEIENEIVALYAGPEAEKRVRRGRYNHDGAHSDYKRVSEIALHVYPQDDKRIAFLRWLRLCARDLVTARWPQIERVAEALLERRTLTADDVCRAAEALLTGTGRPAAQKITPNGVSAGPAHKPHFPPVEGGPKAHDH